MEYPRYQYPVESLYTGSSLGNYFTFARFDALTNLRGLWSSIDNQYYAGEWNSDFIVGGRSLIPQDTVFHPESQTTLYVDGDIWIKKQCFLPYLAESQVRAEAIEQRSTIMLIRVENKSAIDIELVITHRVCFPAKKCDLFIKQPLQDQIDKRVRVFEKGNYCEISTLQCPKESRVFGSVIPWSLCAKDDRELFTEYRIKVNSGKNIEIPFILSFSPYGEKEALLCFSKCLPARRLLEQAKENYRQLLSRSFIFTPEPIINRGLQWAKINTVRVQHRYRAGEGFTNDPPQDIAVLRDLAWYILGSDYLTPAFSKNMLDLALRHGLHETGKVTEYIHANEITPVQHDYNLNINDDTPLLVYALYHHALTSGGESGFEQIYPVMKRICDYILSQTEDGLVNCRTDGVNVWGICGWRNIIDGYNLSGAVTEINAECYFALMLTARVAGRLGGTEDMQHYNGAAEELRDAFNERLLSDKNGMYVLNIDNKGVLHHDVTGDLIFPVLFGLADDKVKTKILNKLTDEEMWTPFGSRTVSKQERNYDPDFGYQLVGGLWHNLTAWIAYCIRESRPDKLVDGMINIYRLSEIQCPREYRNIVPGEFPERIHGETFESRGMAMSPWMPPTYLWLGIEGLLGIKPEDGTLSINPCLPAGWSWIAVKDLLYQGKRINAFVHEGTLYATEEVTSTYPVRIGTMIETYSDVDRIFSLGILIENTIHLFVVSELEIAGTITLYYDTMKREIGVSLVQRQAILLKFPANQKIEVEGAATSHL
jgi:glycogen debranching enzyme